MQEQLEDAGMKNAGVQLMIGSIPYSTAKITKE